MLKNILRKMENGCCFQGDLGILDLTMLFDVQKLPENAVKVTKSLDSRDREAYGYHPVKGLVLAQGESRDHYHAFPEINKVDLYEVPSADNDNNKRLLFVVKETTSFVHEEHGAIEIPAGKVYELFFQYEYNFDEEYARVAD